MLPQQQKSETENYFSFVLLSRSAIKILLGFRGRRKEWQFCCFRAYGAFVIFSELFQGALGVIESSEAEVRL